MSTGGGQTTQTTVQNTDPWKPAQPYLTDLMSQAQGLYNTSSQNTDYAPFNTVVDPSQQTQQALQATYQRAADGSPLNTQAQSSLMSLMQPQSAPGNSTLQSLTGGYNNPGVDYAQAGAASINPALYGAASQAYGGIAGPGDGVLANAAYGGMYNPATGMAGQMASNGPNMAGNGTLSAAANGQMGNAATGLAGQLANSRGPGGAVLDNIANWDPRSNPAASYLSGMAQSGSINPYLDALYGASSKPVIDSVNAQFGLGGRTGSGANQQLLTRDLGDLSSQIHANGWEQAVQNQLAATGQIQNAFDNGQNRRLGAANAQNGYALDSANLFGSLSGQDINNRLGAAQNLNSDNLSAYGAQGNMASLFGNLSGQNISNQLGAAGQLNQDALSRYGAQNSALGLLGNLGQQSTNNLFTAGSQLSGNALDQANTMGNAANNLNAQFNTGNNLQFGAAQAAPGMAANDYTDLQNALNVGGAVDSQQAAQIQDLLNRWQYQQQQPWNLLDNYSGLLTGYAGLGGTASGSQTVKQPGTSLIPSLIGGAAQLLAPHL